MILFLFILSDDIYYVFDLDYKIFYYYYNIINYLV